MLVQNIYKRERGEGKYTASNNNERTRREEVVGLNYLFGLDIDFAVIKYPSEGGLLDRCFKLPLLLATYWGLHR